MPIPLENTETVSYTHLALDKAVKGEEMGRNFRRQDTENESSEKELSSEENVKEESHEETAASDESTTENH